MIPLPSPAKGFQPAATPRQQESPSQHPPAQHGSKLTTLTKRQDERATGLAYSFIRDTLFAGLKEVPNAASQVWSKVSPLVVEETLRRIGTFRNDVNIIQASELKWREWNEKNKPHIFRRTWDRIFGARSSTEDSISPLGEVLHQLDQLKILREQLQVRGEELPPSIGSNSALFAVKRYFAPLQSELVARLLSDTGGLNVAGAVPALLRVVYADGPSILTFGAKQATCVAPEQQSKVIAEGRHNLEKYLCGGSYQLLLSFLRGTDLEVGEHRIAVHKMRVLGDVSDAQDVSESIEAPGKSFALLVEGKNQAGVRKEVILKRQPDSLVHDGFATEMCNAVGLQSYGITYLRPTLEPATTCWMAIEKLNASLLAYTIGKTPVVRPICSFLNSQPLEVRAAFLQQLGGIFAVEHLFGVRDCSAKHILVDRDSWRPFRIDWEDMLAFPAPTTDSVRKGHCLSGDELLLVDELTKGTDEGELRAAVKRGFHTMRGTIAEDLTSPESVIFGLMTRYYPDSAEHYRESILELYRADCPELMRL